VGHADDQHESVHEGEQDTGPTSVDNSSHGDSEKCPICSAILGEKLSRESLWKRYSGKVTAIMKTGSSSSSNNAVNVSEIGYSVDVPILSHDT
jgi:hypothetical protein